VRDLQREGSQREKAVKEQASEEKEREREREKERKSERARLRAREVDSTLVRARENDRECACV